MDALDKYKEEKRSTAKIEAARDIQKPVEQLLTDVHDESLTAHSVRSREETLVRTTARFASLLARLSIDAERGTRSIIRLTWALVILTVALLFLTAYLCYDAYHRGERPPVERNAVTNPQ